MQLAKMSIDPKCDELTADVVIIIWKLLTVPGISDKMMDFRYQV